MPPKFGAVLHVAILMLVPDFSLKVEYKCTNYSCISKMSSASRGNDPLTMALPPGPTRGKPQARPPL